MGSPVIPPPPPGFKMDAVPPPPPGFKLDSGEQQNALPQESQPVRVAKGMFNQAIEGAKGIGKTVGRDAYGLLTGPAAGPIGMGLGYLGNKTGITPKVEAATETNPNSPAQTTGKWLARAGELMIPGPEAVGMLPNAERAGKGLEAIAQQIGHHPVDLKNMVAPALRAQEYNTVAGATLPAAVTKVLERIPQHNPLPTNFSQSRKLQTVLGKLSSAEKQSTIEPVQQATGELAKAFADENLAVATKAGVGPQYQKYIDEYRRAMKLGGNKENAIELAKKFAARALQGAGLGAGYEVYRGLKGE